MLTYDGIALIQSQQEPSTQCLIMQESEDTYTGGRVVGHNHVIVNHGY